MNKVAQKRADIEFRNWMELNWTEASAAGKWPVATRRGACMRRRNNALPDAVVVGSSAVDANARRRNAD